MLAVPAGISRGVDLGRPPLRALVDGFLPHYRRQGPSYRLGTTICRLDTRPRLNRDADRHGGGRRQRRRAVSTQRADVRGPRASADTREAAAGVGSMSVTVKFGLGYVRDLVVGDPRKRLVYSEDSSVTFRRAHDPASEVVDVFAAEVLRPHIGPVLFDVVHARSAFRFAVNRSSAGWHVGEGLLQAALLFVVDQHESRSCRRTG